MATDAGLLALTQKKGTDVFFNMACGVLIRLTFPLDKGVLTRLRMLDIARTKFTPAALITVSGAPNKPTGPRKLCFS